MPQVTIEQPGVAPITVPLSSREVCFGRAEDNDVVLVADEVSRHHVKMIWRGDRIVAVDLKSLNGTYVNRQRIVERMLSHSDEIWLGSKCRMIYRDDGAPPPPDPDAPPGAASLSDELEKISNEMDQLGQSMTLIGKQSRHAAESTENIATHIPQPQATEDKGVDVQKMGRAYRRLAALYQVSKIIASDFDLHHRLVQVLDIVMEITEAERGFIMLRDEESEALQVRVARRMGQDLEAGSPSMGLAGEAATSGRPVLMADRDSDRQFRLRESIIQQRIVSAMCVPLKIEGKSLGSIYVDSRHAGDRFKEEDLELLAAMAGQAAMAIENVRLYERMIEMEKKRANLGRFLSPAIVDMIMKNDTALELGGSKRTVTTMFCDIRGFTPIAEELDPVVLVDMLNEYFTAMTDIIFELHGTLDKYIGDEIMAVFGAPLGKEDDAIRAITAALRMHEENRRLNTGRASGGRPLFETGIGIATGEAIAGYVGSPRRMEFTVIGDRVNTARRLCGIAEPGQICISEATYEVVKDHVEARPIGTVMLKGKAQPIRAFAVEGLKTDSAPVSSET